MEQEQGGGGGRLGLGRERCELALIREGGGYCFFFWVMQVGEV